MAARSGDSLDDKSTHWKEHMFIVHDASQCKEEHDPPENAIIVFLSPVEVEIRTQVYITGSITAMINFSKSITGTPARTFSIGSEKMACKIVGQYTLLLSGSLFEPDDLLFRQLDCLHSAFCFYHGSIDAISRSCDGNAKRFSAAMTRIWSSLVAYFRPPRAHIHSAFRPIPSLDMPRNENRHYAMASQLLEKIQQRPGILGGCVLYRQRAMYTQLSPELTSYALALLQPTQSTTYTEEDNRRIQRRGLKIREMMLRGKNRLIRSREYRLRIYPNCFLGHEMVDLLIEKGEARTRDAAKQLGRRLMQAGIIRHVMNEQDFRDEQRLYRFRVDDEGTRDLGQAASATSLSLASRVGITTSYNWGGSETSSDVTSLSEAGAPYRDTVQAPRSRLVDLRPLVLAGHGRDARTTAALHGLTLPAGVHLLPIYMTTDQLDAVLDMAIALRGREDDPDIAELLDLRTALASAQTEIVDAGSMMVIDVDDAPHDSLQFDVLMAELGLALQQAWLVSIGWISTSEVLKSLTSMTANDLGQLGSTHPTAADATTEALIAAKEKAMSKVTGNRSNKRSADKGSGSDETPAEQQTQLRLYLQGLGSTVLVAVVSPSYAGDQDLLASLSTDVAEGLASLEQNLSTHSEGFGRTESQRTVDEYNFLTFDSDNHGITGWCNTDRSVPEQKLLPDTDEDRAFVQAVTEMHASFQAPGATEAMEIQLRRNYSTAIYGNSAFGIESFLQMRHAGYACETRDDSRPFDDDFAMMPEVARSKFAHHHIHLI